MMLHSLHKNFYNRNPISQWAIFRSNSVWLPFRASHSVQSKKSINGFWTAGLPKKSALFPFGFNQWQLNSARLAKGFYANKATRALSGLSKHNPPANKEWVNSVYSYNKNNLRSLPVKDLMAKKLIKSYFYLTMDKTIARSRRMRNLIRKSSGKKLYISSPEIKQTSDKVNITVYTFDRERQFLLRKLYFNIIKWEKLKTIKGKFNRSRNMAVNALNSSTQKQRQKAIITQRPFSQYNLWRASKQLNTARRWDLRLTGYLKTAYLPLSLFIKRLVRWGVPVSDRTYNASLDKSLWIKKRSRYGTLREEPFTTRNWTGSSFPRREKAITFRIKRKARNSAKTEFGIRPKKNIYKYKPWLKGTYKLKLFKTLLKKRYSQFIKKRKRVIGKKLSYFGLKHYNQMSFLSSKMNTKKKYFKAKKMLLYNYISYFLSLLNIKTLLFEDTLIINKKKLKKLKKEDYEILQEWDSSVPSKNSDILIKKTVSFYLRRFQQYNVKTYFSANRGRALSLKLQFYSNNGNYSISLKHLSFNRLIVLILNYLNKILIKSNSNVKLKDHFSNYSKKYFLDVFYKSLFYVKDELKLKKNLKKFNKDVLTINSILKLVINRFKFGKFLPGLKLLISKVYNKKTELNIVNLKSPHLNTDIFTEAVALKLKKRVGLLRVIRRSLQLVKLPSKFETASVLRSKQFNVNNFMEGSLQQLGGGSFSSREFALENTLDLNKRGKSFLHKGQSLKLQNKADLELNYADSLQTTLKRLYSRSLINKPKGSFAIANAKTNVAQSARINGGKDKFTAVLLRQHENPILNKITSVLNTIKYKWVTGIRLEAAGRLTRRYTASRAVFKFRYKGSLKNTDYSRKLDFMNNSMPNVILRNLVKSNSQHSFLKSKRRIGAFGLKTWMSSY